VPSSAQYPVPSQDTAPSDYPVPALDSRPEDAAWPELLWPPPAGVVLSGEVVDVRPAGPQDDAEGLFRALDYDAVWRHVAGRPGSPEACAQMLGDRASAGWLPWLVVLRRPFAGLPAGAVAGTSSYVDIVVADARLEIGATAYHPALWGTAVNADAKLQLLRYAFEDLGAGRVQLKTDVRNARSQRAIAALGARYEGTLRRYQRRADGTVRDTAIFSVTAEEWPAVRDTVAGRLAERLAQPR
jgi:RimJ/RimL family protein N-acetyltransferase